jgi:hypothetical protein
MSDHDTPRPGLVQWMTQGDIELTEADEQLVDAVVEELWGWRNETMFTVGSTIRTRLQLGDVLERVKIQIEEDNGEVITRRLKVRISRSGMADSSLTVHYRGGVKCVVLDLKVLPD